MAKASIDSGLTDFTIVGPGAQPSKVTLPAGAHIKDASFVSAWVSTVVAYVLGPILDILGLGGKFLKNVTAENVISLAGSVASSISTVAGTTATVVSNLQGNNAANVKSALYDLVNALLISLEGVFEAGGNLKSGLLAAQQHQFGSR